MILDAENMKLVDMAGVSFKFFFNKIFPLSFEETFHRGEHFNRWCDLFQLKKNTCIIAPRKHAKSNTAYAWVMWKLFRSAWKTYSIDYFSYTGELAAYHLAKIKQMIKRNPFFEQCRDMSRAESRISCTWDGQHFFEVVPKGMLAFARGRHPDEIILDDPLTDPTNMLDLAVINKINTRVREAIMSIPKEGGCIKIIGTPQTPNDFMYDYRKSEMWAWTLDKAMVNETERKVLWPEKFSWERLQDIKDNDIGTKAFQKEYMMDPVYSLESFFRPEQLAAVIWQSVDPQLPNYDPDMYPRAHLETANRVVAGWDLGKKVHPSHFSIFELVPAGNSRSVKKQRFQVFWDSMDYSDQVTEALKLVERFRIRRVIFDNTRSELESYYEKQELPNHIFLPVVMNDKNQHKIAVAAEREVNGKGVMLLSDERQRQSMLQVTNELEALDSPIGHGDAFWSNGLVLGESEIETKFTPLNLPKKSVLR